MSRETPWACLSICPYSNIRFDQRTSRNIVGLQQLLKNEGTDEEESDAGDNDNDK